MLFLKRMSDQFEDQRKSLEKEYRKKGMSDAVVRKQLDNPDKYDFFIPERVRWLGDGNGQKGILHLKTAVGSGLNKALEAIEDANSALLDGVLKSINFNRQIGGKTLKDETLIDLINHFDKIPLRNEDFEFPDLLGAAYEYMIKFFADSAGKKGGEFYTPSEVVRTLVQIIEPKEGMSIYDPTVGSGGMLIQSKAYVQETGGDSRNLELLGQEDNGGTWAICKMNMILHGINSSDVRQGDTIKDPLHIDKNGELRRFDRVIANPPFSQNYTKKEIKFDGRFHTWMPESGKKADLMFVQHMVSVLKANGRMACIMPHGVLFRGGEEKKARERFIADGVLEAVIGLPPSLFYGTGIPACVLVMNKEGASERKEILFINADREYKEGKNQNQLRPEDLEKITYVYRQKLEVDGYSKLISVDEIKREEFNLNIRRYVDNSPPPEPHDVRAHLHGGIPISEIDALESYFQNYKGARDALFVKRDDKYSDFVSAVESKDDIKPLIEDFKGVSAKQDEFLATLDRWWAKNVSAIEHLPEKNNVFEVRRAFLESIAKTLTPLKVLTVHEIRGAFANFMKRLASEFKSIGASGWNAELIPEEDILQSEFPEVLEKLEEDRSRILELEALFSSGEGEEEEGSDYEFEESESGVLPKAVVKSLKDEQKALNGELREQKRVLKGIKADIKRAAKVSPQNVAGFKGKAGEVEKKIAAITKSIEEIDAKLENHTALEKELKELKKGVKEAEARKDELVDAARAKISEEQAKALILERLQNELRAEYQGYLKRYLQGFISRVERLSEKYSVTLTEILKARDKAAKALDGFLGELGYV